MQIFVFDGFKRVLSVIKCQEFMPDPSDHSEQARGVITKSRLSDFINHKSQPYIRLGSLFVTKFSLKREKAFMSSDPCGDPLTPW